METAFTPLASLFGGALIGLSSALLMYANGRIAGISGITASVLNRSLGGVADRPGLFFVLGLILATPIYALFSGGLPVQTVTNNLPLMFIAGAVVGVGTVLGNGCTSGHGVCGISRFSVRSITATITFMLVAAITTYVMRHVLGAI